MQELDLENPIENGSLNQGMDLDLEPHQRRRRLVSEPVVPPVGILSSVTKDHDESLEKVTALANERIDAANKEIAGIQVDIEATDAREKAARGAYIRAEEAREKYTNRDLIAEILPLVIGSIGAAAGGGKIALGQLGKNLLAQQAAEAERKFTVSERKASESSRMEEARRNRESARRDVKLEKLNAVQKEANDQKLELLAKEHESLLKLKHQVASDGYTYEHEKSLEKMRLSAGLESEMLKHEPGGLHEKQDERKLRFIERETELEVHLYEQKLKLEGKSKYDLMEKTAKFDRKFGKESREEEAIRSSVNAGNMTIDPVTGVATIQYVLVVDGKPKLMTENFIDKPLPGAELEKRITSNMAYEMLKNPNGAFGIDWSQVPPEDKKIKLHAVFERYYASGREAINAVRKAEGSTLGDLPVISRAEQKRQAQPESAQTARGTSREMLSIQTGPTGVIDYFFLRFMDDMDNYTLPSNMVPPLWRKTADMWRLLGSKARTSGVPEEKMWQVP